MLLWCDLVIKFDHLNLTVCIGSHRGLLMKALSLNNWPLLGQDYIWQQAAGLSLGIVSTEASLAQITKTLLNISILQQSLLRKGWFQEITIKIRNLTFLEEALLKNIVKWGTGIVSSGVKVLIDLLAYGQNYSVIVHLPPVNGF